MKGWAARWTYRSRSCRRKITTVTSQRDVLADILSGMFVSSNSVLGLRLLPPAYLAYIRYF